MLICFFITPLPLNIHLLFILFPVYPSILLRERLVYLVLYDRWRGDTGGSSQGRCQLWVGLAGHRWKQARNHMLTVFNATIRRKIKVGYISWVSQQLSFIILIILSGPIQFFQISDGNICFYLFSVVHKGL